MDLTRHLCDGLILMVFIIRDTDSANELITDVVVELHLCVTMLFTYLNWSRFQAKAAVELFKVCFLHFFISR